MLAGSINTSKNNVLSSQFAVMRWLSDGSVDSSFGSAGLVQTRFSNGVDVAHAVAPQSDGRIIVAGTSSCELNADFAVARYNGNGTLDTSFLGGNDGRTTLDFFRADDGAENVAVQPDGKVFLGGFALDRNHVDGYALARLMP